MKSGRMVPPVDFQLKDSNSKIAPSKKPSAFDLVEKTEYLFVRVVKARDLPTMDITGSLDPYVEVSHGNFTGKTKHFEKTKDPEWNEVFAIPRDRLQSGNLHVDVKDKDLVLDDFVGRVTVELNEVPFRVPPDSPLAPEWYRLEDKKGDKAYRGELMLAVWYGTQADEAFAFATFSDDAAPDAIDAQILSIYNRPKVYHTPRLWFVRVNIIDAHDIFVSDKNRVPEVFCKARIGRQLLTTKPIKARSSIFRWNQELMFVAAEPFEENLILSVEDRVSPSKDEVIGSVDIALASLDKPPDNRPVRAKWYELKKPVLFDFDQLKEDKFSSRLQVRAFLAGGYHVSYESTYYSSDFRPSAKQLWKKPVGLLELGVLKADGLQQTKTRDGKGACDAYCVAKYGHKWVRTRTVVNDLNPKFNEQYTWDVYDHATVLTVGVFDNNQLLSDERSSVGSSSGRRDQNMGKLRIRLSTLESGRVYANSYPLLVLQNNGVKKMGELHLAIRFSATSTVNTMFMYAKPMLPKMHYAHPLPLLQQELLRNHAVEIVAARLARMEPPLRKEVVMWMSDAKAHLWSMRRTKANLQRLISVFSHVIAAARWFNGVRLWKNPFTTVLVHIVVVIIIFLPGLILPTAFLYMSMITFWNFWFRPRKPLHMNTMISQVEEVNLDELDEEFDTYPTSRSQEMLRMRYDRLRQVALKIQMAVGDMATQGERVHLLLSWKDPRATAMFMVFCLIAAMVFYVIPFQVVVIFARFYVIRHPKLRGEMPSVAANFFRRLPARTDNLLL
ncbi:FT-interacting protein 1-like [Canna indica]|uniref:FT-interacting protein 1-like n=1 Tax=Canna indica TaxID=4628 RepID=A0AAQ3KIF0_9LILI|nr:FT-interacting protein 1-like [Canna indica]